MITKERYIELVKAEKGGADLSSTTYESMREFELFMASNRTRWMVSDAETMVVRQKNDLVHLEKNLAQWYQTARDEAQEKVMPK